MKMEYDPRISLGSIVETLLLLLTVIGWGTTLAQNDTRHDERIAANTAVIEVVKTDIKDIHSDLKEMRTILIKLDTYNTEQIAARAKSR